MVGGIEVKNDVIIKCYQYKYCNITKLLNRITQERSRETNSRDIWRGIIKQGYLAHLLLPLVANMDIGDGSAIGEAIQLSL